MPIWFRSGESLWGKFIFHKIAITYYNSYELYRNYFDTEIDTS